MLRLIREARLMRLIVMAHLYKLTGGDESKARGTWFTEKKKRLFVCTRGVVRGVICKCTQNCRRRGAAVGPRSSAAEVETEKKKNRRCACSQSVAHFTKRRLKSALNGRCQRRS